MNDATELKALVEEAYLLFSSYKIGSKIEACCGHCMAMEDCELLLTLPLEQLDHRLIYQYLNAAETNDQYAISQQMKYLLPKILDFLAQDLKICHSNEINLRNCHIQLKNAWLAEEIEFMQRFAQCYFQMQLMKFEEMEPIDQFIIMFDLAELDIRPLLKTWEQHFNHPTALLNLIQMLHYDFSNNRYDSAFADDKLISTMNQWLKELRTNEILINALTKTVECNDIPPEYQYMYDSAFDQLQILN